MELTIDPSEIEKIIKILFLETFDSPLLKILREEQEKAALSASKIRLLLPKESNYTSAWAAGVFGNNQEGYDVAIIPKTIERSRYTLREAIRHEIAHIRNGDLDNKRILTICWFYDKFLKEQLADRYAFKERLPAYYY